MGRENREHLRLAGPSVSEKLHRWRLAHQNANIHARDQGNETPLRERDRTTCELDLVPRGRTPPLSAGSGLELPPQPPLSTRLARDARPRPRVLGPSYYLEYPEVRLGGPRRHHQAHPSLPHRMLSASERASERRRKEERTTKRERRTARQAGRRAAERKNEIKIKYKT